MSSIALPARRLLLCLLGLVLVASQPAVAAGPLTMKFTPDETFGYTLEQKIVTDGVVQGQTIMGEISQRMGLHTKVLNVSDSGEAQVEQTIERVRMKLDFKSPQPQQIEIDSASDKPPTNPVAAAAAAQMGKIVGEAIGMTMSPDGEISDIVLSEKLKQQMTAGNAFGGNAGQIEQMFKQSALRLPQGELKPGQTWDQTTTMNTTYGNTSVKTTYTYNGVNDDGLHKIDAVMDMTVKPVENAPIQVTATTKEANGKFLFDAEAGRMVNSFVKQVMEMKLQGLGQQTVTTETTMTLDDKSAPSSRDDSP